MGNWLGTIFWSPQNSSGRKSISSCRISPTDNQSHSLNDKRHCKNCPTRSTGRLMAYNCVGLFCEDIREEVSGTHTIIGVMPDNITLAGQSPPPEAGASLLFPKLAIYLRLNIETANKPEGSITARASIPGMPEMPLGELGRDAIEQAF